jgi:predicted nucleic-acid-binding protein
VIDAWLDANVILRFLTQDPPDQAARATALFAAVEAQRVRLRLDDLAVCECVWVLESFYRHAKVDIAGTLSDLLMSPGLIVGDRDMLLAALDIYAGHNVDFTDALLALRAVDSGIPMVCSFDRHFDRLTLVTRVEPGEGG